MLTTSDQYEANQYNKLMLGDLNISSVHGNQSGFQENNTFHRMTMPQSHIPDSLLQSKSNLNNTDAGTQPLAGLNESY